MRESRTSGSVRGDRGNSVPYRYSIQPTARPAATVVLPDSGRCSTCHLLTLLLPLATAMHMGSRVAA